MKLIVRDLRVGDMDGVCKLCHTHATLKESHFVPKFIGRWVKKTGVTGYIRNSENVERRAQDLAKEYWLCGDCESLFSEWERQFANQVFYPFSDRGESVAQYGSWMAKLCASLTWRTLTYIRSKNADEERSEEYIAAIDRAELHLRRFLLGEEANLGPYEQHLYPVGAIESTDLDGVPVNINRYFLRTIAMDIVGNATDIFVYTKLPGFILLGVVKASSTNKMRSSRIALKQGKLSPTTYRWPDGLSNYLFKKAEDAAEIYRKIPESQREKFDEFIMNNPEKAANSKLFEAFKHDFEQFGDKVFKKD
jgi:hypothetical protein